jgi:hypothetical protein
VNAVRLRSSRFHSITPSHRLIPRLRTGWLALSLAFGSIAGLGVAATAAPPGEPGQLQPPEARFYIAWGAPYGQPGARENTRAACDSAALDTLYLSFDSVGDASALLAATATLHFWPAPGETLASHWRFDQRGARYGGLRAELNPEIGLTRAWDSGGTGGMKYRSIASGGTIRLVYAVPSALARPVKGGQTYPLARVFVPRPPVGQQCERPVCIEWEMGSLAFSRKNEPTSRRGSRFVSWGSPNSAVCATYRRLSGAQPWKGPPGR